eukprot:TRINITY_DN779997_c0_g1_i1.p1 TRINITY_DN779997_c0_g1~~TRINITY_DN779997_c0_g1_i1.p1  ORF type:complete len:291 (+),score=80.79 TRINITY_DN779997_c0_g1_i1:125-997(+)
MLSALKSSKVGFRSVRKLFNGLPLSAVIFDIDGTIKPFGEPVTSANLAAIEEFHNNGTKVFLATGRCESDLYDLFPKSFLGSAIPGFVGENGAVVRLFDGETLMVHEDEIFNETKKIIQDVMEKKFDHYLKNGLMFFQDNIVNLCPKPANGTPADDMKIMVDEFLEVINQVVSENDLSSSFIGIRHWDAYDMMPVGLSKAKGASVLLKHFEIPHYETLFCGDAHNDPFEEMASIGIHIATHENATDYAKEAVSKNAGRIYRECSSDNFAKSIFESLRVKPCMQAGVKNTC